MSSVDLLVLTTGTGLIIFILWFFFGSKGEAKEAQASGQQQNQTIIVEGGYTPEKVIVKKDLPVTITFDRRDQGACTEWVIFKELPTRENKEVKARLPEGKRTTVSFTPSQAGEYDFSCGMGMVHGKLIVKD